jgi:antirestriction protein ArdC
MATANDIRIGITDQIVEALKSGGLPPWRRPWAQRPKRRSALERGQR